METRLTMSDKLQEKAEMISALVDGQLQGEEWLRALDHLENMSDARMDWDTYHVVGEALRSSATPLRAHDPLFLQRLRRELVSDTSQLIAQDVLLTRAKAPIHHKALSANDAHWRQVMGLAFVVFVGIMAWQGDAWMVNGSATNASPQLAQMTASPAPGVQPVAWMAVSGVSAAEPVMIRDPQLDALLAAHRQFGGATALQTPSGFLRNATFNEGSR
jgi:sigma-E factor negative regulatory protein RseA